MKRITLSFGLGFAVLLLIAAATPQAPLLRNAFTTNTFATASSLVQKGSANLTNWSVLVTNTFDVKYLPAWNFALPVDTYVMQSTTNFLLANTDSTAFLVTLPSTATEGWTCQIKLTGTNALTITNLVGLVDGTTNIVLSTQNQSRSFVRHSTNYWIF